LRIALDATPLAVTEEAATPGASGVGGLARYTSQLVAALARAFPQDEFILLSDQPFELPDDAPNLRAGGRPNSIWERRWWTFGLQRELKRQSVDVFHGVNFAVPFPPTMPAVMTIHDLSPWVTAQWIDDAWRTRTARVRKRVPWMIRTGAARHIITPSEAIRREVINFFRIDPARVTAIPLAAADHFRPQPAAFGRPYFLYAGMLEARKNVAEIISAWLALRRCCDVDLVLAGPHREEMHIAPLPGLKRRGVVSESELAALYSGAIALVYPSLYEGFGLPVLEAMQCGTPVIISSDPALVETAGDAGIDEARAGGLEQAMRSLLENPDLCEEMRSRSLRRAAQFSWERTARATHAVYRSMVAE
jgi:glycosyltransferase involved in cell wall biosynthesis